MRFRFKTFFLCFLYAVVLTGVLLYYRFPAEEFKKYCVKYVESIFPGVECNIGSLAYKFPFSFQADNINFTDKEEPEVLLFESKSLLIVPHIKYPLDTFSLSGELYGGSHSSKLSFNTEPGSFTLTGIEVKDFDLKKLILIQEELGRTFFGKMTLRGDYTGKTNDLLGGSGRGKITVKKGRMELLQPILSLPQLDIRNAEFDFSYKEQELEINNGQFDGKELRGNFSGGVAIESEWLVSELDLIGELTVESALFAGNYRLKSIVSSLQKRHKQAMLPYNVSGLVADPVFRFGK